jgi:hypothetical protein
MCVFVLCCVVCVVCDVCVCECVNVCVSRLVFPSHPAGFDLAGHHVAHRAGAPERLQGLDTDPAHSQPFALLPPHCLHVCHQCVKVTRLES